MKEEIANDVAAWPVTPTGLPAPHLSGPPPYVDFDPLVSSGQLVPDSKLLGVRRLFRIASHNASFRRLCLTDERIVSPVRCILGNDLKLVQSMALLKPPGTGEKRWHQDQGVFRLTHPEKGSSCVVGWWIALDTADADNGCMHFHPGSQHKGIVHHMLPVPASATAHIHYSVAEAPPAEETVYVPLDPGDALLFDVACVHGTPANNSKRPRQALQMQYAPSDARPTRCPRGVAIDVVAEVGAIFDAQDCTPSEQRHVTPWFDCDADFRCTEPQFWSYRKAEATVCGRLFDAECI